MKAVGEPLKKLRQDGPGVPLGSHDGPFRKTPAGRVDAPVLRIPKPFRGGRHGEGHVRPRVRVGNGVDIDGVEVLPLGVKPLDAGKNRPPKASPIQIAYLDHPRGPFHRITRPSPRAPEPRANCVFPPPIIIWRVPIRKCRMNDGEGGGGKAGAGTRKRGAGSTGGVP
jgi:hypothetical protein